MARIEFNTLRPCLIGTSKTKGLLHGIFQESYVVAPSLLKGGHPGGVVAKAIAIVEVEGGHLISVDPTDLQMLPGEIDKYAFPEDTDDAN